MLTALRTIQVDQTESRRGGLRGALEKQEPKRVRTEIEIPWALVGAKNFSSSERTVNCWGWFYLHLVHVHWLQWLQQRWENYRMKGRWKEHRADQSAETWVTMFDRNYKLKGHSRHDREICFSQFISRFRRARRWFEINLKFKPFLNSN